MKWIRVKDELPDRGEKSYRYIRVLVYGIPACACCSPHWSVREAQFRGEEEKGVFEFGDDDCPIDVTHWMWLPLPPDEE